MGKIRDILASEEQVQKLYQHLLAHTPLSSLSPDARAFALLQLDLQAKAQHK